MLKFRMLHAELVSIVQNQTTPSSNNKIRHKLCQVYKAVSPSPDNEHSLHRAEGEFMLLSGTSKRAPSASALTWEIYSFAQKGWELHKVKKQGKIRPCRCALSFAHFVL